MFTNKERDAVNWLFVLSLCVSMPLESLVEIKIEFECRLHFSDIYNDDSSKRQRIKMKENANIPLKYCLIRELCVEVYCLIFYWRTRSTTLTSSWCRWGSVRSRWRGRRRGSWWISRWECTGSRSRTPTTSIFPVGRSKI